MVLIVTTLDWRKKLLMRQRKRAQRLVLTWWMWLIGKALSCFLENRPLFHLKMKILVLLCSNCIAHLSTVCCRYESAFLVSMVGLRPEKYFWMGFSNTDDRHTFKWTTRRKVKFTNFNVGLPGTTLFYLLCICACEPSPIVYNFLIFFCCDFQKTDTKDVSPC